MQTVHTINVVDKNKIEQLIGHLVIIEIYFYNASLDGVHLEDHSLAELLTSSERYISMRTINKTDKNSIVHLLADFKAAINNYNKDLLTLNEVQNIAEFKILNDNFHALAGETDDEPRPHSLLYRFIHELNTGDSSIVDHPSLIQSFEVELDSNNGIEYLLNEIASQNLRS